MSVIPEAVIESAWSEIAELPESQAQAEIERIGRGQPALLAFVMADTEELSQEAQELGLFLFVIVLRMFEKHYGRGMKTVELESVERLRDATEESMLKLADASEEEFEQAALSQASTQPYVMKYIAEAIFDPNPGDGIQMTEDEIGALTLMLRTVVEALEEAATPSTSA
jgi:hypothetical protein